MSGVFRLSSVMDSRAIIRDRKSTRLNSSHSQISYAVFCLKKKKKPFRHDREKIRMITHNNYNQGIPSLVVNSQLLKLMHLPPDTRSYIIDAITVASRHVKL